MPENNLKNIIENIQKKELGKALELCAQYQNNSNSYLILNFKGIIHLLKNNLDLAEDSFLNSIKINGKFEGSIKNLYLVYLKKKKYKELISCAQKLILINPINNEHNFQLAYAFELNGNFNLAIKQYKIYISNNGKDKKKALNNIGGIEIKKNKPNIALNYFLEAANIEEDSIILNNILNCYIKLRDYKNSDKFYKKIKNLNVNCIEFIFNKVQYLVLYNEIDEAIKILEKNLDKGKFLLFLLRLYFNTGQNKKGGELFKKSLKKLKDNNEFYNYLGLRFLYEGNFSDGWKYYEYRSSKKVDFFKNIKEWTGEKINKKSIVVFNEQGLGDAIQFSKYLIPLSKISGNINFVVKENIIKLFRNNLDNLSITTIEDCKCKNYDFKISLGSLVKFFYTEEIKQEDNLVISNKVLDLKWKNQISNFKLNVGLAWSGSFNGPNEPYRSIPLQSLQKILNLNANFYCLQNEIWDRDEYYFKLSNLINCGMYPLNEIASIIKNLDLIITVDTSILHLSGSLNKETWFMKSLYPDWRWGKFNNINPYKSVKFFEQSKFNNWDNVVEMMFEKLKTRIIKFNQTI